MSSKMELLEIHSSKLRVILGSMIIVAGFVILSVLVSSFNTNKAVIAMPAAGEAASLQPYGGPNTVASGLADMAGVTANAIDSTEHALTSSFTASISVTAGSARALAAGTVIAAKAAGRVSYRVLTVAASAAANTVIFVVHAPIKAVGWAAQTLSSSSVARPADNSQVPVIDTQLATLYPKDGTALQEHIEELVAAQAGTPAAWPINGRVTTLFGVPHRPYQDTHTGLDISSGQRSGITLIKPFRPGTVTNVVSSKYGLGNHVVVDHGNGLTSLYAHMYSISVSAGQTVEAGTTLGLEGSTGVSTGTHLHCEIRQDGRAMDPRDYIAGQP